jgi:hypothetical protein
MEQPFSSLQNNRLFWQHHHTFVMAAEECNMFSDSISQDGGNQEGLNHSQAFSRQGLATLQDSSNIIRAINSSFLAIDISRPAEADPHEGNMPEDFTVSHDLDSVGGASSHEVDIVNGVAGPTEADPHEVNMPEDVATPKDYHSDGEASSEESVVVHNQADCANVLHFI